MYIFTSIVLFIFVLISWNYPNSKKKPLYIIGALWLFLIEGLRWQIGTDWDNYYNYYVYGEDEGHMEYGFSLIVNTLRSISNSYTFYLLIQASMTIAAFSYFIRKFSPDILMSLCIFFCSMVGLWGMNRQFITLDISLFAIYFIQKRKALPFFITLLFASFIHKSAFIFLPAYFLYNFQLSSRMLIMLVGITVLIGLSGILKSFGVLNAVALYTSDSGTMTKMIVDDANAYSYLGTIKRLFYILLFSILHKKLRNNMNCNFLYNMYIFGALMFFTFNGSNFQLFVSRGALCYNISEIILLPMTLYYVFKKIGIRLLAWSILFLLIFMLMNRDLSSYISIAGYDVFRPYKSVLF